MIKIDQLDSILKQAAKPQFQLEDIPLKNALVLSDMDEKETARFRDQAADFLACNLLAGEICWHQLSGQHPCSIEQVVSYLQELQAELICTYRNLYSSTRKYPHSLGSYVDILTQATSVPILVLPDPQSTDQIPSSTRVVMAIADHLTGDHHLVNYAARMTSPGGRLLLTHVEDQVVFQRYMDAIRKVPSIDTKTAEEGILAQLLNEPHDYIRSCANVLQAAHLPIAIKEIITLGHSVQDYKRLIDRHRVDLLVLNTKQEDQLAMHGVAYPLCVEMRQTPILML